MKNRFLALLSAVGLTASGTLSPLHAAEPPVVVFKTSHGEIKIKLNPEKAPVTVENFLKYVKDGFYDNTVFHRVVPNFVVQGGGFARAADGKHTQKGVKAPIKNEASNGLSNALGTISMARTSNPDSATSQFFLNIVDNTQKLDPGKVDRAGYAVFGEITEGLDVAKKIEAAETTTKPLVARQGEATSEVMMQNVPAVDAVLLEAYVEGEKREPAKLPEPAKAEEGKPAADDSKEKAAEPAKAAPKAP